MSKKRTRPGDQFVGSMSPVSVSGLASAWIVIVAAMTLVAGTMTCSDPGRNTVFCGVSFCVSAVRRVTAIGQPNEIKP